MSKHGPRSVLARGLVMVLLAGVPGLIISLAIPASAATNLAVTVIRPAATPGPFQTFSEVTGVAHCPVSGGVQQLVAGGGVSLTFGADMAGNGNHVNGTEPNADAINDLTGTATGVIATNPAYWMAVGGSGGATETSFSDTPFAMCFTPNASNGPIKSTDIVMNRVTGPLTASGVSLTVATCPSGNRLLSGGARATPASRGSLKPVASYPTVSNSAHDFGAKASADGEINPDSWAAWGLGGGPTQTMGQPDPITYAYAVCAKPKTTTSVTTTVRFTEVSGPTVATTGQFATATCKSTDGGLAGGGAAISNGNVTTTDFNVTGSVGDHQTGSFPSDASGHPVVSGTASPTTWTAATHTGGVNSPNTFTDVWAMCAVTP